MRLIPSKHKAWSGFQGISEFDMRMSKHLKYFKYLQK